MRTINVNVFKFSELSAEAKEQVKRDYAEAFGYAYADDAVASLKALTEHFGGKLTDWNVDFFFGQGTAVFRHA